jgi:hypothetical protein
MEAAYTQRKQERQAMLEQKEKDEAESAKQVPVKKQVAAEEAKGTIAQADPASNDEEEKKRVQEQKEKERAEHEAQEKVLREKEMALELGLKLKLLQESLASEMKSKYEVISEDASDHSPFAQAGAPSVTIIDFEKVVYHVPEDTIDNIGPDNLDRDVGVTMQVI